MVIFYFVIDSYFVGDGFKYFVVEKIGGMMCYLCNIFNLGIKELCSLFGDKVMLMLIVFLFMVLVYLLVIVMLGLLNFVLIVIVDMD